MRESMRRNRSHKKTEGWLRTALRRRVRNPAPGLGRSPTVIPAHPHKALGTVRVMGQTGAAPLGHSRLWWSSRPAWIHLGRPGAKRWTSCCRWSGMQWTWAMCGVFPTSATKTEGVRSNVLGNSDTKAAGNSETDKCDALKQILCRERLKERFPSLRQDQLGDVCLKITNRQWGILLFSPVFVRSSSPRQYKQALVSFHWISSNKIFVISCFTMQRECMRDRAGRETLTATNTINCVSHGWDLLILFNNLARCCSINSYLAFTSKAHV